MKTLPRRLPRFFSPHFSGPLQSQASAPDASSDPSLAPARDLASPPSLHSCLSGISWLGIRQQPWPGAAPGFCEAAAAMPAEASAKFAPARSTTEIRTHPKRDGNCTGHLLTILAWLAGFALASAYWVWLFRDLWMHSIR